MKFRNLHKTEDIYTAAVPELIRIHIHVYGCRVSKQNRYLHGSHSRAKSAVYIAAGCIKIVIYTAAVQEPNRLYTFLPGVCIKLLLNYGNRSRDNSR